MRHGVVMCAIAALTIASTGDVMSKEKHRGPVNELASRIQESGNGFYHMALTENTAMMSVGKPPGLSYYGAWITSDYEPDPFSTYFYWCDAESTRVIASFYAPTSATASGSIKVYNAAGTSVFTDQATGNPEGASVYAAVIGQLPVGNYRVAIKIKQGRKVIGDQFWMSVYAGSDPACEGIEP